MDIRPELPADVPARILKLPRARGYPVPWFVAWIDADENPVAATEPGAVAEFRVTKPLAAYDAHRFGLCWICGQKLGRHRAFLIGPMCAVNRLSAEPPSHVDCADWSARACPFLTRPHAVRRDGGLPESSDEPAGTMIRRNPGVILLWQTRSYRAFLPPGERYPDRLLFRLADPERTAWYAEGRPASRAEVDASIESGLPLLERAAEEDGPVAVRQLARMVSSSARYLPAAA